MPTIQCIWFDIIRRDKKYDDIVAGYQGNEKKNVYWPEPSSIIINFCLIVKEGL